MSRFVALKFKCLQPHIMDLNIFKILHKSLKGSEPDSITPLPQSGSDRVYFRIGFNGETVLGAFNPLVKENEAYISFTEHFQQFRIPVPAILKVSEDNLYYLVEDLGDESLYNKVLACKGNLSDEVIDLYKQSLRYLVKMQIAAGQCIDYSYSYPVDRFDQQAIHWDLNYFKYNFLKLSGVDFNEYLLEKDFNTLSDFLLDAPMGTFMFRDFQSRNIMIKDNKPHFIDFQGGREGPKTYDVASLLYQAKAQIPYETRKELFTYYFNELSKNLTVDYDKLVADFKGFALLRTLQVLGAYGFRGYYEKKPHFIDSIPYALKNLNFLLLSDNLPVALPHLKELAVKLSKPFESDEVNDKLTIRLTSFSYRKGIPADPSNNGGGFVFDCRGIHNPGRYKEYQQLTGKNESVIKFFKENTNIDSFVENVINTIEPTIENYLNRGFDHLSINFGCTGGQHRSVYCTEALSNYIQSKFDTHLIVWHREQGELVDYGKEV